MSQRQPRRLSLIGSPAETWRQRLLTGFAPLVERLIGLRELERGYQQLPEVDSTAELVDEVLKGLAVRVEVEAEDLQQIPDSGAVAMVSNHPYGGIEGLILAQLLFARRPDVKIMANYLLGRIAELRELFILVDPFATAESRRRNLAGLRQTMTWLAGGGALAVFPAGEVAHLDLRRRRVVDPPWDVRLARIVLRAACPVVPVYFTGHNGPLFQIAGLVHERLRTLLLVRELLKRRGSTIEVRIGRPIPAGKLTGRDSNAQVMAYLRAHTELLADRPARGNNVSAPPLQPRRTPTGAKPVTAAIPAELLVDEVQSLPPESLLVDAGKQAVYVAGAAEIPYLLREIGRLRELTFRAAGEGTGRELDLDRFDQDYLHLFLWNRSSSQVIGAYRLGMTEQLLAASGRDGLYTSTLFSFDPELFTAMGPAVEMGRSFIRPEHQRSFTGLMLLWKGIGAFVLRHPRYSVLFGPVSISADYRSVSQQLMVAFLKQNLGVHEWSRWVRPRTRFRPRRRHGSLLSVRELGGLDDVSSFVAELEPDRKGVPILLKQYLKLGGALLGFNVDPDFSNVLDVLILVDLRQTPAATLVKYMGREGAEQVLARPSSVTEEIE
jgi:putative hemolysin